VPNQQHSVDTGNYIKDKHNIIIMIIITSNLDVPFGRGEVEILVKFLLALASRVILGSESLGTHDHTFVFHQSG
jgi:hypothetical protein